MAYYVVAALISEIRPNGTPRKLLDVSKATDLGWTYKTDLEDGIPQSLFYMASNICWFYFSDCLKQSSNTFLTNQHMFGKVYFPRLIL